MAFPGDPSNSVHGRDDEDGVSDQSEPNTSSLSSFINARLGSNTPRSRQSSPGHSPRIGPSRFSSSDRFSDSHYEPSVSGLGSLWGRKQQRGKKRKIGRTWYGKKSVKGLVAVIVLLGFFLLFNWMMLSRLQDHGVNPTGKSSGNSPSVSVSIRVCFGSISIFTFRNLLILD